MAKFYGPIGYAITEETSPGVWDESITERNYYGDVIRNTMQYQSGDKVNDDINLSNQISIIADPFAYENFYCMKYVGFMGTKWKISNAEIKYPRIILTIGGVYNGN